MNYICNTFNIQMGIMCVFGRPQYFGSPPGAVSNKQDMLLDMLDMLIVADNNTEEYKS